MKKIFIVILLVVLAAGTTGYAQIRLNGAVDILKTEFFNEFPNLNMGLELNYFAARSIALTGGVEMWNKPDMPFGVALGARWYPINPLFFRLRGILSDNSDFNIGLGYTFGLSKKWYLEVISDYYAVNSDFALRMGVGVRL